MLVTLAEEHELIRILRDLEGTDATHGRAGILVVDRTNLRVQAGSVDAFPSDLPPVLQDTVVRLNRIVAEAMVEAEKEKAIRALSHLYRLLQQQDELIGRAR
jgi:hypothetical protein